MNQDSISYTLAGMIHNETEKEAYGLTVSSCLSGPVTPGSGRSRSGGSPGRSRCRVPGVPAGVASLGSVRELSVT
jgi:hypothetical protein